MTKNDWQEAGDQFKKLVQDAVDSNDFSKLGSTLGNVVNDTVNGLQSALQENLSRAQGTDDPGEWYQRTNRAAADRIRRNMQEKHENLHQQANEFERKAEQKIEKKVPMPLKAPGELTGNVMKWTGYSMGGIFGVSTAVFAIICASTSSFFAIPTGIMAVLCGANLAVGIRGSRKVQLAKRFRRYMKVLGDRTYCMVEELAASIGQNSKFVQKDLKKMIGQGFFKEGYLDRQETLLITDKTTYQQYLDSQTAYEQRRTQAASQAEQEKSERFSQLPPQCREILEEGQKYIRHIHECNEKIPGEEISAKLDRLELVVTKIFRETEKNPAIAGDLKKLMSYYLPTTAKLLDAYCELDSQPVAGQNIETTKREIEGALDTINTAFENLLDDLFQDEAWDISSDITVLHTMLAQEGLMGKDFQA
jgi:5-bromo-4-chloroindolyl phosphate hydrolysis protein